MRFGEELLRGRTPRQEELARRIFERFKDGADVNDVKELIEQLCRTAAEDARYRDSTRQTGGTT